MVCGPWLGIADLSFSMLVMMNSGSEDSIAKLSIVPQLPTLATILLSGILFHLLNHVKLYGRASAFVVRVGRQQNLKNFHVQNSI